MIFLIQRAMVLGLVFRLFILQNLYFILYSFIFSLMFNFNFIGKVFYLRVCLTCSLTVI